MDDFIKQYNRVVNNDLLFEYSSSISCNPRKIDMVTLTRAATIGNTSYIRLLTKYDITEDGRMLLLEQFKSGILEDLYERLPVQVLLRRYDIKWMGERDE